jgi:hypothetical protein
LRLPSVASTADFAGDAREHGGDDLLGGGLAGGAGDADDGAAPPAAPGARQGADADAAVVDPDDGAVDIDVVLDEKTLGAGGARLGAEGMPVVALAADGDVELAAFRIAPVEGDPGEGGRPRPERLAAGGGHQLLDRQRRVDGGGRLLAVVEVDLGLAEDLVVLVPLAGDEHHVAGAGETHRHADGRSPVGLDEDLGAGLAHAGDDGVDDGARLLGARVVRGDHRHVGVAGDDGAHPGPLGRIAIAAAAEDDDEPARRERAQRGDDPLQRVGRVGVVDDDVEAAAVGHPLDAAGDAGQPSTPALMAGCGRLRASAMPTASARLARLYSPTSAVWSWSVPRGVASSASTPRTVASCRNTRTSASAERETRMRRAPAGARASMPSPAGSSMLATATPSVASRSAKRRSLAWR